MKPPVTWLFFLAACGGPPRDASPPPKAGGEAAAPAPAPAETSAAQPGPSLAGTSWRLTELGGKSIPAGQDGKSPTLDLATDGNRAAGFAGCNRMSGTWEARGDSLRLGPFAVTRMMCDKEMDLEQEYLDALQKTRTYRLSPHGLDLIGESGTVARLEVQ